MKPLPKESLAEFFSDLDRDFAGLKSASDDVFIYNSTDVLVQTTWELPIVIQWPESVVNFEFNSHQGNISFTIVFVAAPMEDQDPDDLEIETIQTIEKANSEIEPISGSFELPCEGVVFFIWVISSSMQQFIITCFILI